MATLRSVYMSPNSACNNHNKSHVDNSDVDDNNDHVGSNKTMSNDKVKLFVILLNTKIGDVNIHDR